jgi:predicted O-methyltransferase YrrM
LRSTNVLWQGKAADVAAQDEDTIAIRALNAKLRGDERIASSLLLVADGMTLAMNCSPRVGPA